MDIGILGVIGALVIGLAFGAGITWLVMKPRVEDTYKQVQHELDQKRAVVDKEI